jgi:hypothetical protein
MFNLNVSDGREAKQVMRQTADDVDQVKRSSSPHSPVIIGTDYGTLRITSENQLRVNVNKWLSPPDPSTNHNIACDTHLKKMATWFIEGSIFREWISTAPLLWIHGKRAPVPPPTRFHLMTSRIVAGSGKSILWLVDVYLYPS